MSGTTSKRPPLSFPTKREISARSRITKHGGATLQAGRKNRTTSII